MQTRGGLFGMFGHLVRIIALPFILHLSLAADVNSTPIDTYCTESGGSKDCTISTNVDDGIDVSSGTYNTVTINEGVTITPDASSQDALDIKSSATITTLTNNGEIKGYIGLSDGNSKITTLNNNASGIIYGIKGTTDSAYPSITTLNNYGSIYLVNEAITSSRNGSNTTYYAHIKGNTSGNTISINISNYHICINEDSSTFNSFSGYTSWSEDASHLAIAGNNTGNNSGSNSQGIVTVDSTSHFIITIGTNFSLNTDYSLDKLITNESGSKFALKNKDDQSQIDDLYPYLTLGASTALTLSRGGGSNTFQIQSNTNNSLGNSTLKDTISTINILSSQVSLATFGNYNNSLHNRSYHKQIGNLSQSQRVSLLEQTKQMSHHRDNLRNNIGNDNINDDTSNSDDMSIASNINPNNNTNNSNNPRYNLVNNGVVNSTSDYAIINAIYNTSDNANIINVSNDSINNNINSRRNKGLRGLNNESDDNKGNNDSSESSGVESSDESTLDNKSSNNANITITKDRNSIRNNINKRNKNINNKNNVNSSDDFYYFFSPFVSYSNIHHGLNISGMSYGFVSGFNAKIGSSNTLGFHFGGSYGNMNDNSSNATSLDMESMAMLLGLHYKLDLVYDMYIKAFLEGYYFMNDITYVADAIYNQSPNNIGYGASVYFGKDFSFDSYGILGAEIGIIYNGLQSGKMTFSSINEIYESSLIHLPYIDIGINYNKIFNSGFGFNLMLGGKYLLTTPSANMTISNIKLAYDISADNYYGYGGIGMSYFINNNVELGLQYLGNIGDVSQNHTGFFNVRVWW